MMGLGGSLPPSVAGLLRRTGAAGTTDGRCSEGRVPRIPVAIRHCLIRVSSVAKKRFLVARKIEPCRRSLWGGWIMEPALREGDIKFLTVRNLVCGAVLRPRG